MKTFAFIAFAGLFMASCTEPKRTVEFIVGIDSVSTAHEDVSNPGTFLKNFDTIKVRVEVTSKSIDVTKMDDTLYSNIPF